jgi:hypothetical protein
VNSKGVFIGLALLAMPALSGCVAAIPAVAALAVGGSQVRDDKKVTVVTPDAPVPQPDAAPAAVTQSAGVPASPVSNSNPNTDADASLSTRPDPGASQVSALTAQGAWAEEPQADSATIQQPPPMDDAPPAEMANTERSDIERSDIKTPDTLPSPSAGLAPQLLQPPAATPYDRLADFAADRSADFNLGRGMKSVVYNPDSGLENPTFAQCGEKPLAIILDLDNKDLTDEQNADLWRGAIDPAPGVLAAVNEARRLNIAVFYMSEQLAQSGIRIEAALNEAGLGPAEPGIQLWLKGERGLERKDLLRQVISRHYCVVAMAGDRKGDFADLYDYLRDPDAPAVRVLDPLFNAGWFMLPNPVVAAHSNDKD